MVDEEEDITQICTKNREQKRNRVARLQVAGGAQNPIYSIPQSRFLRKTQPATFGMYTFFLLYMCSPIGGFFFLFFIILYIIYNNIYKYISILQIHTTKNTYP